MIVVSGTITIDPDKRDRAAELTGELTAETRKESGNISYAYYVALADPASVRVFEEWESQAAIDEHMASPHMAAFLGAAGDLGISAVDINQYEVTSKTKIM